MESNCSSVRKLYFIICPSTYISSLAREFSDCGTGLYIVELSTNPPARLIPECFRESGVWLKYVLAADFIPKALLLNSTVLRYMAMIFFGVLLFQSNSNNPLWIFWMIRSIFWPWLFRERDFRELLCNSTSTAGFSCSGNCPQQSPDIHTAVFFKTDIFRCLQGVDHIGEKARNNVRWSGFVCNIFPSTTWSVEIISAARLLWDSQVPKSWKLSRSILWMRNKLHRIKPVMEKNNQPQNNNKLLEILFGGFWHTILWFRRDKSNKIWCFRNLFQVLLNRFSNSVFTFLSTVNRGIHCVRPIIIWEKSGGKNLPAFFRDEWMLKHS